MINTINVLGIMSIGNYPKIDNLKTTMQNNILTFMSYMKYNVSPGNNDDRMMQGLLSSSLFRDELEKYSTLLLKPK